MMRLPEPADVNELVARQGQERLRVQITSVVILMTG